MPMTQDQNSGPESSNIALIVEDEAVFIDYIKSLLSKTDRDWTTHAFQKGQDALAFLESSTSAPSIALVDLGLPDMSGVEVIDQIHSKYPRLPILVISVLSSEKNVLDAIRAGASGYLLKEDHETSILQSLKEFLNGNYPISAGLAHYLFKLAGKPEKPADIGSFSKRELEILNCIAQGMSYMEAAAELDIRLGTVQTYIRSLYKKLDAHSQVQAISAARKKGLIAR